MVDAPATETPPTTPATEPVSIDKIPAWARRTIIGVLLVGAMAAFVVWGIGSADPGTSNLGDAIVTLSPGEGAQVPIQTAVGADLKPGYDGRLTITNGGQTVTIPEEQMEGARDPATVDPDDLAQNGLRPNNRNSVYFKPGPGKVIEEFTQGEVVITLRYFPERREGEAESVTWTIRVD